MVMRCNEIQPHLVDLLYDEDGPAPANLELQDHLRTCSVCHQELEELKQTRKYLKEWKDESPLRSISVARQESLLKKWSNWTYLRYAALAAMVLLCFLALANTELTWSNSGFSIRTSLFRRTPEERDYYTKSEVRDLMKRALDDSEVSTNEVNRQMIEQMLDTVERDRYMDMRLVRGSAVRGRNMN
jgi:hypothetical protein